MPRRIQLSRKAGWRKPEGAVVVSRPGAWGNPFQGASAARSFRKALMGTMTMDEMEKKTGAFGPAVGLVLANMRENIRLLRGRDLCCWCPPGTECHADVLIEFANMENLPW